MSYNIIKCLETDDYISFKTECADFCHDIHISLEKDLADSTNLIFSDTMYIDELFESKNIFSKIYNRLKVAFKFLFNGYYEFEYGFVFKSDEHVDEVVNYLVKCRKKFQSNSKSSK